MILKTTRIVVTNQQFEHFSQVEDRLIKINDRCLQKIQDLGVSQADFRNEMKHLVFETNHILTLIKTREEEQERKCQQPMQPCGGASQTVAKEKNKKPIIDKVKNLLKQVSSQSAQDCDVEYNDEDNFWSTDYSQEDKMNAYYESSQYCDEDI